MLERIETRCLLKPTDIEPSRQDMEVVGVFNPGVAEYDGGVVMLVRVAERAKQAREGFISSPRYEPGHGMVIDWVPSAEVHFEDPRVFVNSNSGTLRLTFCSYMQIVQSADGKTFDPPYNAVLAPESEFEEYGIEDARISRIDDIYYITYVAVSRHGACTALASTVDFQRFRRHGIIFPSENKDVVLFPGKIGGQYIAIHRPNPRYHFGPPKMWLARSPDLIHWGCHSVLNLDRPPWNEIKLGGGTPPMRTEAGWLTIYHGNKQSPSERNTGRVGTYIVGAMLLDLECPERVIGFTREPIMVAEYPFEKDGFVNNVLFPTGLIARDGRFRMYYGAADSSVGLAEFSRERLLDSIEPI